MTIIKKRRAVSHDGPRYPDGQVGRRRFLRELGFGAAAVSALPLMACVTDNDAQGAPRTDWKIADGGVAPPLDAAIDQPRADLHADLHAELELGVDGSSDAADDVARADGGIPDGAGSDGGGTDGAGDGGAP